MWFSLSIKSRCFSCTWMLFIHSSSFNNHSFLISQEFLKSSICSHFQKVCNLSHPTPHLYWSILTYSSLYTLFDKTYRNFQLKVALSDHNRQLSELSKFAYLFLSISTLTSFHHGKDKDWHSVTQKEFNASQLICWVIPSQKKVERLLISFQIIWKMG